MIKPYGPLMSEHRVIERMITVAGKEKDKIKKEKKINPDFINKFADFLKTYADKCHHGKEENILFAELSKRNISEEHEKIMDELLDEHEFGRKRVKELLKAKEDDDVEKVVEKMNDLIELYPQHISKEDNDFFIPCMNYFSEDEQDEMTNNFWKFDREMIHNVYKKVVSDLEKEYA